MEEFTGAVNNADAFLGLRITKATKAEVYGEFVASDRHLNNGVRVAGMALTVFAEALGATGILLNLPKGMATATIESKTNYMRAATRGLIRGQSVPLHLGRTTMVWQTTIFDEEGNRIAIVMQTQIVLPADGPDGPPSIPLVQAPTDESRQVPILIGSPGSSESTRDRVLAAAADVIQKKGFAAASMRDIAAAAKLSVSSIYQYVESKDDLLALVFDGYMSKIIESVSAATHAGDPATDRLRAAIDSTLKRFSDFRQLINLMNRETRSLKPAARRHVLAHMTSYVHLFRDIVADGIKRGEFREDNPDLTAHLIVMLCEIWPQRHWAVGQYGSEAIKSGITDLVIEGLRARQGRRRG